MQKLTDAETVVGLPGRQVTQVVNDETRCVAHVRPTREHHVQTTTHHAITVRRQLPITNMKHDETSLKETLHGLSSLAPANSHFSFLELAIYFVR